MMTVWIVAEFHNCHGDGVVELDGESIVAIYDTEQTARQHVARAAADHNGALRVRRVKVRTALAPRGHGL